MALHRLRDTAQDEKVDLEELREMAIKECEECREDYVVRFLAAIDNY